MTILDIGLAPNNHPTVNESPRPARLVMGAIIKRPRLTPQLITRKLKSVLQLLAHVRTNADICRAFEMAQPVNNPFSPPALIMGIESFSDLFKFLINIMPLHVCHSFNKLHHCLFRYFISSRAFLLGGY